MRLFSFACSMAFPDLHTAEAGQQFANSTLLLLKDIVQSVELFCRELGVPPGKSQMTRSHPAQTALAYLRGKRISRVFKPKAWPPCYAVGATPAASWFRDLQRSLPPTLLSFLERNGFPVEIRDNEKHPALDKRTGRGAGAGAYQNSGLTPAHWIHPS